VGGYTPVGDLSPPSMLVILKKLGNDEIRVGNEFKILVNTNYLLRIEGIDDTKVVQLWLEDEDGGIIKAIDGDVLELPVFEIEPKEIVYTAWAKDVNGNLAKEEIKIEVAVPEIKVKPDEIKEEGLTTTAYLSQKLEDGKVGFYYCQQQ